MSMMINFLCQLNWTKGYSAFWQNIISEQCWGVLGKAQCLNLWWSPLSMLVDIMQHVEVQKEEKCGRKKICLSLWSGRSISTCFHTSVHSWHFEFRLWLTIGLPRFCEPSAWTRYVIGLLRLWNHVSQCSIMHFSFLSNFQTILTYTISYSFRQISLQIFLLPILRYNKGVVHLLLR